MCFIEYIYEKGDYKSLRYAYVMKTYTLAGQDCFILYPIVWMYN